MENTNDISCLKGQSVTLPGGRDKEGRPIITLTIPADSPQVDPIPALQYLLSLFSKASRLRGLTVIIDARKGPWKNIKSCIRQVTAVFCPEEISKLIVLRTDAFWDKQRLDNCTSSSKNKQVNFIPRSRLSKFVDLSQLPVELGGNFLYNHEKWIQNRQKVEDFFLDCDVTLNELEELQQYIVSSKSLSPSQIIKAITTCSDMIESTKMLVFNVTETGKELVENIEYDNRTRKLASEHLDLSTPQDTLDTIQKIDEIITKIRKKQHQVEEAWKQLENVYNNTKEIGYLEDGIEKVTNWILGTAEERLNSHQKVGFDVASAEELRREHEAIELECWETYGTYSELIHKIDNFVNTESFSHQNKNLMSQKDFMDFVCESFAIRLERRRNVLNTCLRFYRLVSEYFDRTAEVFDRLVIRTKLTQFEAAALTLKQLEENQASLDLLEFQLRKEGEKLSEMLSMSIKDCLGREVNVDYSEDLVNIRDVLDATTARKNIFSDSVELQKLTLNQITHINSYEKDIIQAIKWIDELLRIMLRYNSHIGCTVYEIQRQKDEHLSFQETAKGTHNYGCHLLNASLVLRQSCKLPLDDHANLYRKLKASWQKLLTVNQEQMMRIRVSSVFHRSVEEQCNQLRDLRGAAAIIPLMDPDKKQNWVDHYFSKRERLIIEVSRTIRLGKVLRSRLKEPLCNDEKLLCSVPIPGSDESHEFSDSVTKNEVAIEAISARLSEVIKLAEEVDYALQSAQQDCLVFTSITSSTSSLYDHISPDSLRKEMENPHEIKQEKPGKPEDVKSDDEFLTASDCTLLHSRSSSYNTASECENRYSPWWDHGKEDINRNISKEKMVLAVGLPELPLAKEVLKPTPEVPPGKIVREVIETTHLKVNQSHTLGVASFVLSSETVTENKGDGSVKREEVIKVTDVDGKETVIPVQVQSETQINDEELERRLKECGDWISLKILEITPELTSLGNNLEESLELQKAHDEVLRQLQNKQSPVEELLRQADQLIATQRPRAEVYAAMAESLGRAWKDINSTLELRKDILDLNVLYHKRAQDFFENMDSLESLCKETVLPVEIETVKNFLTMIHEQRRALLDSLMGAMQAGNTLLAKLKELGAEGTLDSRPDKIRASVNKAISQVQEWLDELHLRRQFLEGSFSRRKTQLEQCLALAILAADLRELEEILLNRRELLANSNQFGDSSSSAELLLHEHKKLLPEAKQLQERALKITKATEKLMSADCYAGEEATNQSYAILSSTSDYLEELQSRESLLERVISFFRSAQMVIIKLNQLEIQLTATELPKTSPQLAQLHLQCSKAIEDATAAPIAEGYAILDAVGRGSSGIEGVKQMVEELENKKIILDSLCTAHREENIRIYTALNNFLEKHNEIYSWLVTIAEAFLHGHQDMGSDLPLATDFYELHNQLLTDLQTKGNEINTLLLTLPPILEYLEDSQRKDVDVKVEQLHDRWMKLKNILETRMELSRIYVKFHMEADIVNKEMDKLDKLLVDNKNSLDEEMVKRLEEKFESIVPLYQCAKNTGLTFINQAKSISEPHLDTKRACLCVQSILERLSERQLVVTRNWQTFHTEVEEKRELLVRLELTMEESTKTISWVSKVESQLYPIITTSSTNPKEIADHIEDKISKVLTEIRKSQADLNEKLTQVNNLIQQTSQTADNVTNIKNKLQDLHEKLQDSASDYQVLSQVLVGYFRNLEEIDKKAEIFNSELDKFVYAKDVGSIDRILKEHESQRETIIERLRFAQAECDQISKRVNKQEPAEAAQNDISKLNHVLELNKAEFENQWKIRQDLLKSHRQILAFDNDLKDINNNIDDLNKQIKTIKSQYGESVPSAKATSQAFVDLEETVKTMEERIQSFTKSAEKLIAENHTESPHIQKEIAALQEGWNNLKNQVKTTRNEIDTNIHYFQLVEEADEWFRQGSKLLVSIARKSTSVKSPEEAEELLHELSGFLEPGEENQNERIDKISQLAVQLYGPNETKYAPVLLGNNEMIDSFNSIRKELKTLAANLRASEEEKLKIEKERAEAQRAEEARKLEEERLKEEERIAEEARRAEEHRLSEEKRKAEEARLADAARVAREKIQVEELRLAEEKLKLEAAKQAEEARLVEERKKAEEDKLIEQAKLADERRQIEEEKRKLEEIKLADKVRKTEEARLADEKRQLEEAEAKRREEEEKHRKLDEEREKQEKLKTEQKKHSLEITEITDIQKIEIQNSSAKRIPSPIPIVEDANEPPVFISPLSNAVIQEGNKFTFMCQVTGHPIPNITWYKAGISIQNNPDYRTSFLNGLCSLTIEETFAEDSARYTCRAINPAGEDATSAVLSVNENEPEEVLLPPSFVKPLQPASTKEGSPFRFECQVEGNPLPIVQWFKNGDCIDNSPDYSITYNNGNALLKFETVNMKDKAEYSCKASNQLGSAQCTANLVVTPSEPTEAPAFIAPLSNVMARAGQKIKLECEISGLPIPTLTWSHNGKPVKETREIKLQQDDNKATLLILEAFPKDAGTYAITAENIAGKATSTCSVSVKGRLPTETSDSELASDMEPVKPSIQLPLNNATAKEGTRVRLDCVIVGQPEPEVIWYHDERPVKESHDFQLLFQGDRCSLVIQEVLLEDGGEYKVVALNSAGEASSKCILSVTSLAEPDTEIKPQEEKTEKTGTPPKFVKLLTDVLVSEGDKVILDGNVVGEPRPEIKWLLNNLPITDTEHFIFSYNEEGNVRLEIENVKPEDKGVYTVKAVNSLGEAKCFSQLIVKSFKPSETVQHEEVKQAPEFKESFTNRSVFEETSTKFECIVIGKPTPKIKWLFNNEPISGKDFLISTSGNRQVLSIPNVKKEHSGSIACLAENEVGRASCLANLIVESTSSIALPDESKLEIQPLLPLSTEKMQHVESSYKISKEIVTQSQTTHSSKIISSAGAAQPHIEEHRITSENAQIFKKINEAAPEVKESHKIEEYHKIGDDPPLIQEKSSSTFTIGGQQIAQPISSSFKEIVQKPLRIRPPKFITPVIGKIVDQDVDIILEGILDGQPVPQIKWTKNGEDIKEDNRITIKWELNRTSLEIKNVTVNDAGRYSCTAVNEGGTAVSTADLVVRKTIFPPVFGRRLQAQVIKNGDRVIMEVEVTGTPEPTVTWYKDGNLIEGHMKSIYKVKSMGQCHKLIIDKAEMNHSGRYMVRATNSGGEAQSIADIAIIEPAPDSMVEVVKTVVFEDVRKHETLTSTADNISAVNEPKQILVPVVPKVEIPSKIISSEMSQSISSKSEVTSTTEQMSSQEKQVIKLEHKMPDIPLPKPIIRHESEKQTDFHIVQPSGLQQHEIYEEKKVDTQEGIETSSISKQSSLQYFVKKIKEGDTPIQKESTLPESIKPDIYQKFEQKISPPVPPKPEPIKHEYQSFTSSQTVQPSQEHYQSFKTTEITNEIQLQPEPPAEICYAPKPSSTYKKHEDVSERIKRLSENQKELSPHEVPTGAIKIFPLAQKSFTEQKTEQSIQSSFQTSSSSFSRTFESSTTQSPIWTPKIEQETPKSATSEKQFIGRPLSAQGEPSQEGLIMEKQWAHKFSETHQEKSWPPPNEDIKYHPSWSVQSTLEKKWTPNPSKPEVSKQHYIAEITDLGSIVDHQKSSTQSFSQSKSEYIIEKRNAKPSEIIKSWPPAPPAETKSYPIIETLPIRPVSVQDITDEVYLEPGPPPVIAYAPPCPTKSPKLKEWVAPSPKECITPSQPKQWIPSPSQEWVAPPPLPPKQELVSTPIVTSHTTEHIYDNHDKHVQFESTSIQHHKAKLLPPPSPSKFVKGEFRESDYEGKIHGVWGTHVEPNNKPVHPVLTPTKQHGYQYGSTPPTTFEHPHQDFGPFRPKFEPIKPEVKPTQKNIVYKPKPISGDLFITKPSKEALILKPGSPPEIGYAPSPKTTQYYKSTVTAPYTNAIQHETSNVVHFNESTDTCHRTMSVQQTHKVIKFGDKYKKEQKLENFPFQPEPEKPRRATSVPPPPTPSKFIPGEFRESDYESEVENTRIKAKWSPHGTQDGLPYRKVKPPSTSRSSSVPAHQHRVLSPMEFDTHPVSMPSRSDHVDGENKSYQSIYRQFSENKSNQIMKRSHSYEPAIQSGSPPKYGYAGDGSVLKSTATKIASDHMDTMTHAFKSKTQKFVTDIMSDVHKKQPVQPALKNGADGDAHVYREESRAAQYGTKHVDPDTGLIYFKYDFGYEFGIILPGESKGGVVPTPKKTIIEPPKRTRDIELPVYHEKSSTSGTNNYPSPQFKPKKFMPSSKPVKWDPTSESEMSEYEGDGKVNNNLLQGSRWEPSSCSPASLSPSLPSTSPAFNNTFAAPGRQTPPSCPSTPGSLHKTIINLAQARAPMFITPLRDIAVVSGQAAKFECIVQSEPQPNVLWSKNGRIIENSRDYQIHFRNGVCRLTISQAYPEDAGTYCCTATNQAGTANTTAALEVPGERRSQYIK